MNSLLKFNKFYFLLTLILFCVEVLIAKYVHDKIIRPYIGDLLVVILIYCFVRSFLNTPAIPTALAVLAFSYMIETLQYFKVVNLLGLQNSKIARIIIGTAFEWADLAVYTIGIVLVIYLERLSEKKK